MKKKKEEQGLETWKYFYKALLLQCYTAGKQVRTSVKQKRDSKLKDIGNPLYNKQGISDQWEK